jgi:cellulose synthase/poly-beta-1,6-N-acetylglucosamine synthase-like glycosyltransferase
MRRFSTLAGRLQSPGSKKVFSVSFRKVMAKDPLVYRVWARLLAYGSLGLVIGFGAVLFQPKHWIIMLQPETPTFVASLLMLVALLVLQFFLLVGTYSATRATLRASDPIPVRPPRRLRVAFVTTRAPGEPVEMAAQTLAAAKAIRYKQGSVDVWLLDETNSPELQQACAELGVRYFTRQGIEKWNTQKYQASRLARLLKVVSLGMLRPSPSQNADPHLTTKTKHGNFNAWRAYLAEHHIRYDILAGVDTDQIPEANYLERMLGYFHDPNVAYVVGPQVYGNYRPGLSGTVARWAESQASFFQSTIQRAANASASPMFVGTNYAVRMKVLDQIGGFQPCITEDMATGLAIHAAKNPVTNVHWKSVYTPDVLAVGEGPDLWGTFFTQQWRWAAGTFDTWRKMVWRVFFKLPHKTRLHYLLILTFYPMTALAWPLGIISSMVYLTTGATAILAPWNEFASLYLMLTVMQLSLYFWNRRYNVSPHEPEGSYGVPGMIISTIAAPVYFSAFMGILLGKKPGFVVTTKGDSQARDRMAAFRTHLQWALLIAGGIGFGILNDHHHPAMMVWAIILLVICLAPVVATLGLALSRTFSTQRSTNTRTPIGETPHAQ